MYHKLSFEIRENFGPEVASRAAAEYSVALESVEKLGHKIVSAHLSYIEVGGPAGPGQTGWIVDLFTETGFHFGDSLQAGFPCDLKNLKFSDKAKAVKIVSDTFPGLKVFTREPLPSRNGEPKSHWAMACSA